MIVEQSSDFLEGQPVLGGSWPLHIQMNEENQLWLEEEHDLVEGQEIYQQQPQGTFEQLFDAFGKEWTKRWDKHANIPPEHWSVLVDFIQTAFQNGPSMQCDPIDCAQWNAELKLKPKHAATGMDGVSVHDLRNLPDSIVEQLLKLITHIENTGEWPDQLTHGAVHSLQKVPNACKVTQFRPITILPVVYRLWSSIRCKQLIRYLQQFARPGIYGNVTGKSATAMWYELQLQIEIAQWEGTSLTGSIADIVKAFNCLPRIPILAAAVQLGVHPSIIRPWTSMLTSLTRHFVIRKSYGPGLKSTTGLAEGCGLSVAGMMITNIVMHKYMSLKSPSIAMMSYVDNWEMNAEEVEDVIEGMQHLEQFCTMWDLQLDQNKTIYWSINASARQTLRQAECTVIRSCRDLGGHMQFTKQKTNRTLADKSNQIRKLWPRLHQCRSPLRHKFKVLRCKAWPRVLHSCPAVHVNHHIITNLRRGAMQGLGLHKPGANPLIQLSWVLFPTHDPECYAIFSSVRHARRFASGEALDPFLEATSRVPERQQMPGPIGVLVTRLAALGWTHGRNGVFYDLQNLPIDVFRGAYQEVAFKIARDWQQSVGRQVQHRSGFEGAQNIEPFFAGKSCKRLSDHERGLVRAAMNGTFFTEDFLGKIHGAPPAEWTCPQCGSPDSIPHRYWDCPATAESRTKIPAVHYDFIQKQPEITRHRGWLTQPPEYVAFQEQLLCIPDQTADFMHPHQESFKDAFTDGTGIDPTQPHSRLVAWGWVIGCTESQQFFPMACGGVPGSLQTIGRAELVAVLSVLKYVCAARCPLRVWIDNQYILDKVQQLHKQIIDLEPMQPDHDLWEGVQFCLQQINQEISFHKVCSHQIHSKLDAIDQWICSGNDSADQLAQMALETLPFEVRHLQKQMSEQVQFRQQVSDHLIQHIIRVGNHFTQQRPVAQSDRPASSVDAVTPIDTKQVVHLIQDSLPPSFTFAGVSQWLEWFAGLTDQTSPITWVTWHELLVSYQLTTGKRGVRCQNTTTGNHRQWEAMTLREEYDFPTVSRFFGHILPTDDQESIPNLEVIYETAKQLEISNVVWMFSNTF